MRSPAALDRPAEQLPRPMLEWPGAPPVPPPPPKTPEQVGWGPWPAGQPVHSDEAGQCCWPQGKRQPCRAGMPQPPYAPYDLGKDPNPWLQLEAEAAEEVDDPFAGYLVRFVSDDESDDGF